ncbi:MAG: DUF551 domain-containing protein [Synergistaceae bacterium]|jgi:hypothetical protein
MTDKAQALIDELVAASIAFGRGVAPDWQTRIEDAKRELRAYIDEVEGLEEDSGSYDSLIPDWANEPKQRWIPVSERLPEVGEAVLIAYRIGRKWYIARARMNKEGQFRFTKNTKPVTHWMPLPESPIVYGKVCIDQLTAHYATERQDDKWIPVSERLPDNWKSVLTIDISKSTRDMVTAFYNPETSLWSSHFSCDLWVTHWMPLPEPPIVYGKVCEE